MARATKKKKELTLEEKLEQALVPKEDQPYEVPENWCWCELSKVASIIMGQSPKGTDTTDDSSYMPLIGGAADMGEYYPIATRYTKKPTKISKCDDIIICIRATLGRPIYSDSQYCLGRGVASIRPLVGIKEMYRYWLINNEQYLYDNATGSTFAQVSSVVLQEMPIPLMPLKEQHRIVNLIESLFAKLDEAKDKAQAVVDGFEDRKAAILHKAFTGELTVQWRKRNGQSFDQWENYRFDDCVDSMQNGIAKRKGSIGDSYVVLRLANFSDEGLIEDDFRKIVLTEEEQERYKLHVNDVLMIRVNGTKDNVGKQYRIMTERDWAFCDHIIRIRYVKNILSQYMVYFSKSEDYKQYIKNNMVSSAGQNTISRKGMGNLEIPIPPHSEQIQIVAILDQMFEKERQVKGIAKKIISEIDTMKKSILARAFRGQLGTNDPDDENALELLKTILKKS